MPAPKPTDAPAEGMIRCTVSRRGAGKISTGERTDEGDITFAQGDAVDMPRDLATHYEDMAYVAVI